MDYIEQQIINKEYGQLDVYSSAPLSQRSSKASEIIKKNTKIEVEEELQQLYCEREKECIELAGILFKPVKRTSEQAHQPELLPNTIPKHTSNENTHIRLSDKEKKVIKSLFNKGIRPLEISRLINRRNQTVYAFLNKYVKPNTTR